MMQHIADEAEHIYLALGATDFQKQQNGLAALISLKLKLKQFYMQQNSVLEHQVRKHFRYMGNVSFLAS